MIKKFGCFWAIVLILTSFQVRAQGINTGPWRFEIQYDNAAVPFIIDFQWEKKRLHGTLYNGKEVIKLRNIIYRQKDIKIPIQIYEITLELKQEKNNVLTGYLIRHNKNPIVKTPVIAFHGVKERYPGEKAKPEIDLNGKWSLKITDDGRESPGVAVFEQKGNYLTGSILTPTGDYRYLEGYVSGTDFEAASFDGMYNYVIRGRVKSHKLEAEILANYKIKIEGTSDNNAALPDPYKQTQLEKLEFKFPEMYGKLVTLNDAKFKGKPVIVQLFGSWCPNCMDELNFLVPWYKENSKRGIEVIALAFERSLSNMDAKRQIIKVIKKKHIPYTVLMAGTTSEDKPMEKIPTLKNFISFPTTIFLNKSHEVVKVHAGFSGPSTGEFYEKWKTEFENTVTEILK